MKRVLTLTLVVAVLLAGCAGPLQTAASDSDGATISISATGSATADPDVAVVSLGVEATTDGAADARAQVARGVASVRTALADAGVPEANVTTTAFGISPVYERSETNREVVGYRAIHALTVETTPDRAGAVVDLAVGAGATSVDGVRFTLSDERRVALRATALDRAMATARTDADGLAAAADRSVTGVQRATADTGVIPYPVARFEDTASGTVLQPATVSVTVTVDVTYSAV
jgi:uncharacterized protein YggE